MINLFQNNINTDWDNEFLGTPEEDIVSGEIGNDLLKGGDGNDILAGKEGNDLLKGGDGSDLLDGGIGNDSIIGNQGNDILTGREGNDLLKGGNGNDTLDSGVGNDSLIGGRGNDILLGREGNDLLKGGNGNDTLNGGVGNDSLIGGRGNDSLEGQEGNDLLEAGNGSDTLNGGYGEDSLFGRMGKDLLISMSDAGEPEIAQESDASQVNRDRSFTDTDDELFGGQGADTFLFEILLNAKPEIMEKHANARGVINWRGVAGENDNVHDHWVEGVGNDTIADFNRSAGDKIDIIGHTVDTSIEYATDGDGREYSIINLVSNQGGAGAHDGDRLGTISVYGDLIAESDLNVDRMAFAAVYENIGEI